MKDLLNEVGLADLFLDGGPVRLCLAAHEDEDALAYEFDVNRWVDVGYKFNQILLWHFLNVVLADL